MYHCWKPKPNGIFVPFQQISCPKRAERHRANRWPNHQPQLRYQLIYSRSRPSSKKLNHWKEEGIINDRTNVAHHIPCHDCEHRTILQHLNTMRLIKESFNSIELTKVIYQYFTCNDRVSPNQHWSNNNPQQWFSRITRKNAPWNYMHVHHSSIRQQNRHQ